MKIDINSPIFKVLQKASPEHAEKIIDRWAPLTQYVDICRRHDAFVAAFDPSNQTQKDAETIVAAILDLRTAMMAMAELFPNYGWDPIRDEIMDEQDRIDIRLGRESGRVMDEDEKNSEKKRDDGIIVCGADVMENPSMF